MKMFHKKQKLMSKDGLTCLVHHGPSVVMYDHGVMSKVMILLMSYCQFL